MKEDAKRPMDGNFQNNNYSGWADKLGREPHLRWDNDKRIKKLMKKKEESPCSPGQGRDI
jgi:hypothetical protein